MGSVKTPSLHQALLKNEEDAKYLWTASPEGTTFSRALTNLERTFEIYNNDLYGQNCPITGASITFQSALSGSSTFTLEDFTKRATNAFTQTRYIYPTVAARIDDRVKAVYKVEDETEVQAWANRTVRIVKAEGGWLALREKLSRASKLPSDDGDCCIFYIIINPRVYEADSIDGFHVLMHAHHVFVDGAGIRSILDKFLERFAAPISESEISWGRETERLLPPSLLLDKASEPKSSTDEVKVEASPNKGFFANADVGLPVYRPDIQVVTPEIRGTLFVAHTFPEIFLPKLLTVGRNHGFKLTSVLHASLLKAMYDCAEAKPAVDNFYNSPSSMDLRKGHMYPEFCLTQRYVNSAIAPNAIQVLCRLFENGEIWKAVECISEQWAEFQRREGILKETERMCAGFVENWSSTNHAQKEAPAASQSCPYYVSDPPGSQQLSPSYKIEGIADKSVQMVIESYQIATDQNKATVCARSHSWKDRLTLCIVFNAIRNPRERMQEVLDHWVSVVAGICEGQYN